jgi:hypothetical protein
MSFIPVRTMALDGAGMASTATADDPRGPAQVTSA